MKVPQSQYLHSQNFNSKFIEFVWKFPEEDENFQVIFITFEDGMTYQEEGLVDAEGDYTWGHIESPVPLPNKYLNLDDLHVLREESIEFLN